MTSYERALEYIRETLRQIPTQTATRFNMNRTAFRDTSQTGGAQVEIELLAGQSRVFEVDLERAQSSVVAMGQAVPSSYTQVIPVRVRYEGTGPHVASDAKTTARQDQMAIVDALHRNQWHTIPGLVHLTAEPGGLQSFSIRDGSGKEYVGYLCETFVTFSHDL